MRWSVAGRNGWASIAALSASSDSMPADLMEAERRLQVAMLAGDVDG